MQQQSTPRPLPAKGVIIAGVVLSACLAGGLAWLAQPAAHLDDLGRPIDALSRASLQAPAKPEEEQAAGIKPNTNSSEAGALQAGAAKTGQPQPSAPARDGNAPATTNTADDAQLPPPVLLGSRVGKIDAITRTLSTLVLVEDARSYLDAIAAWTPARRFPVLIDDGTVLATDNISRFARAFAPKHIVRWKAADGTSLRFDAVTPSQMRAAASSAWDATDSEPATFLKTLLSKGVLPPGIVIVNAKDDGACTDLAWTAGVALAAARGQPLVAIETKNAANGAVTVAEADELAKKIEAAAQTTTLKWNALGDDLDAITLTAHTPGRIDLDGKEFLALTDRLGRLEPGTTSPTRWAWCGQIFGDAQTAAYRAMSSIFVRPTQVFYFDGYQDKSPFNLFDCTKASEIARESGYTIEVMDLPNNTAKDWRSRAARPFDAGMIFVTTHGNPSEFNLNPGEAGPGDLPLLGQPAIIHFVHSFSVMFAGNRDTIAGRWLERGSHFYVGSVHEPYLSAFLPTPGLNARMLSGAALGAAVRVERPEVWKITVLGDPLLTLLPTSKRIDEGEALAGAKPIDADLRDALVGKRFGEGFHILALQGRDRDLARLFAAAQSKEPASIDAVAARWSIIALARSDDADNLAEAFLKLTPEDAKDGLLRDALWLVCSPKLAKPTDAMLAALRKNLRSQSIGRDATVLANALTRSKGAQASAAFLNELRSSLTDKAQKDNLEAALKKGL